MRCCFCIFYVVLLQHGADPNIKNTDGKTAQDLSDPSAKAVLTGKRSLVFPLSSPPPLLPHCNATEKMILSTHHIYTN